MEINRIIPFQNLSKGHRKTAAIICLFLLTACSRQETAQISCRQGDINASSEIPGYFVSYPAVSSDYVSSHAVSSVFHHPDQTGDTVSLNIPADEIVKIEFLGTPQINIVPTETEDKAQIAELVQELNDLVITDDNTLDYGKMSGRTDRFILYYRNGDTVEISYTTGGIIIRDSNYKYGNRWLRVRNSPGEKISMLLENLH